MNSRDTFDHFAAGRLHTAANTEKLDTAPWKEHKEFSGVFLKTLLSENQTDGLLSCLLVRIEPGCRIGLHRHPASLELHEVVTGDGVCILEGREMPYQPGGIALIPRNAPHEVRAGADGLRLFAKFITLQD